MGATVVPLLSTGIDSAGQPLVFPKVNGRVSAWLYEIGAGETLPVHRHPFPRLGYVLDGLLRVTSTATGESRTYEPGAFVVESVNQWHKGSNPGTSTLKLLVVDLIEEGAPSTIRWPAQGDS